MTARAVFFSQRRGACPGLSVPMPTGDGLLVRLIPVGTIPLDAFVELCAAARKHGNGVIEITARGSIQIRGLNVASAPRFADAVAALRIAAADGIPVRNGPLAGIDPEEILDATKLAADLRRALAGTSLATRLAPKVSVAIDGGGALNLDQIDADVRLQAELIAGAVLLRVGVGGDAASGVPLGAVTVGRAVESAVQLLDVIARHGRDARARNVLATEGLAVFRSAIADFIQTPARPRESGDPRPDSRLRGNERKGEVIGPHRLHDGSLACGVGLAFGHADAASLQELAAAARAAGANGLRAAAGRALLVIGFTQETAPAFVAAAEHLGFIVRAHDPRRYIFACAGAPVCASAYVAARAIAPSIAEAAARPADGAYTIHISGCAKGCAHPASAALTAVGTPNGYALIADGSARDAPFATIAANELPAAIARHVSEAQREAGHV
jgi:precorrin-3B synthase